MKFSRFHVGKVSMCFRETRVENPMWFSNKWNCNIAMRKQRQNIIEVDSSTREGGVISEHGTIVQVNKMCIYIYIRLIRSASHASSWRRRRVKPQLCQNNLLYDYLAAKAIWINVHSAMRDQQLGCGRRHKQLPLANPKPWTLRNKKNRFGWGIKEWIHNYIVCIWTNVLSSLNILNWSKTFFRTQMQKNQGWRPRFRSKK